MAAESQAEIAASVAALQDLGPGYDQALAEGLVERIGADIDKRIAAQIDARVTAEVDSRVLLQLDRYASCPAPAPPGPAHASGPNGPTRPDGRPSCCRWRPCWSPCR